MSKITWCLGFLLLIKAYCVTHELDYSVCRSLEDAIVLETKEIANSDEKTALTGLHAFTVFLPYLKNSALQEKLIQLAEEKLSSIGQVVKLQDDQDATDVTGFGTGNYLILRIRNV